MTKYIIYVKILIESEELMCVKCERKSKRLGIPKGKFGKVKFWAHRFLHDPIPLFNDKRLNVAIEAHLSRIEKARTKRPKNAKDLA